MYFAIRLSPFRVAGLKGPEVITVAHLGDTRVLSRTTLILGTRGSLVNPFDELFWISFTSRPHIGVLVASPARALGPQETGCFGGITCRELERMRRQAPTVGLGLALQCLEQGKGSHREIGSPAPLSDGIYQPRIFVGVIRSATEKVSAYVSGVMPMPGIM